MKVVNTLFLLFLFPTLIWLLPGCSDETSNLTVEQNNYDRIQPYPSNPYYWQYKGEPVLLIGGSWQDNLFNHPTMLAEHLDVLVSAGGNYARNTMSHRNVGNVFAWEQNEEGLYDLNRFYDEYWNRFEHFLELAFERDIIVQIEIWDPWDLHEDHQSFGGWSFNPFNPSNNINYTPEESGLPVEADYPPQTNPTDHPFWRSVPELHHNELLLSYQKAFVDKLLSYSLEYPNILYCMNNETGEPNEWGDFWADYVQARAEEAGVSVFITDMRRNENIRSADHLHIFDNPERYTFVDISQNNAWSGLGQAHYDNILYVRDQISGQPRPINNNKNYGAARHGEDESVARMSRIFFAGAASARFHRPHPYEDPAYMYEKSDFGLGLSPRAQKVIRSLRTVFDEIAFYQMEPRNDLLGDRNENEAYLLANPGNEYAIYFQQEGSVTLNTDITEDILHYRWINIDEAEWSQQGTLDTDSELRFTTPGPGQWIVVIQKTQ
ncbi:MAG: hypothetical protein EA359_11705 [Balneolaceae bacterium]|nr:MAG: hypothetical protein EA359_11705 [Balneolaceae bacterium]